MIEVKAKIIDVVQTIDGKCRVTLEYKGIPQQAVDLMKKAVRLILKEWREKRSLDANAYCWKLCTEIANVLTLQGAAVTKDEIYEHALKSYGQSDIVTIRSDVPPERFFDYYEEKGKGVIKDVEYTHYKVTVGSSHYDSREMSILIAGIVQEAEALGIHTIPPDEAEQLAERWGK